MYSQGTVRGIFMCYRCIYVLIDTFCKACGELGLKMKGYYWLDGRHVGTSSGKFVENFQEKIQFSESAAWNKCRGVDRPGDSGVHLS